MKSPYPITIDKITLGYRRNGSDKEYHLVLIQASNNQCMTILRYGKRDTWGQMDVNYGSSLKMSELFQKKLREKTGKGYEVTHQAMSLNCGDSADLRRHLGDGYWAKLSTTQREYLLGSGAADDAALNDALTEIAETARPVASEAERYRDNPLWGAF